MQVNVQTSVAPANFPAGTNLGQMRFRLTNSTGLPYSTLYVDVPLPPVVTFPNVGAGAYTLSIQRLSAQSIPLGAAYTAQVVVAEPAPLVGDVPVGAVVSVE